MHGSTTIILVLIIVVLLTMVVTSFRRHMRWEERRMKWRFRIFMHTLIFFALVAVIAVLVISSH